MQKKKERERIELEKPCLLPGPSREENIFSYLEFIFQAEKNDKYLLSLK